MIKKTKYVYGFGQVLGLQAIIILSSCGQDSYSPIAPPAQPRGYFEGALRLDGTIGNTSNVDVARISPGVQQLSNLTNKRQASSGVVALNFVDTDIRIAAADILGTQLKLDYTIDPAVHGTATLHTSSALSREQLLAALEALLAQNGAALIQSGPIYRVVPEAASTTAAGSAVVTLRYTSAEGLARTLQPFVGSGRVVADPARNALIISGDPAIRGALENLARAFDIDLLAGQSYAVLPVNSGDAKDFATILQEALRSQSGGALAGRVQVLPMTRIDSVLVVASEPQFIADARRVYDLIDRKRRDSTRDWHIYYLRNSRADETTNLLQRAFTPNDVTSPPSASGNGKTAPGSGVSQVSGGGSGTNTGGLGSGLGSGGIGSGLGIGSGSTGGSLGVTNGSPNLASTTATTSPNTASTSNASNPLLGGLDQSSNAVDPAAMRIISNPENQAVLVYATPHEQDLLQSMLRKIDIMPLQVRIDATIAEVDLNDQLQFGTQFFFKSGGINGILSTAAQTLTNPAGAVLNSVFPGFQLSGSGAGGAPIALSALQAVTKVHVLSSPQILVQDNQPARLQVGQLVPYLTQSSQSTITSGSPVINSINYQPTGVIMQVTPRINSEGLVTLDIAQEVSSIDTSVTATKTGISSPTFTERNVTSRVVVQDGDTVGLAGLIQDSISRGNSGIPWLKDIPVLGLLAGTQDNVRTRTELLVLITPHVVHDARQAQQLTEDLREQMHNAASVPAELNNVGPSGSADPSRKLRKNLNLEDQGQSSISMPQGIRAPTPSSGGSPLAVDLTTAPPPPATAANPSALEPAAIRPAVVTPWTSLNEWQVQLSATNSEASANAEWQRLTRLMPELLGTRPLDLSQTIRDGQVFWRVRTGRFGNPAEANFFCSEVRSKGLNCFTGKLSNPSQ
jgi:general secretion pathway protein D